MNTIFNNGDVVTFRHEHLKIQVYGVVYTDKFGKGIHFGNLKEHSYGECTLSYAMRCGLRITIAVTDEVRKTIAWVNEKYSNNNNKFEKVESKVIFNKIPENEVIYEENDNGTFEDYFNNLFKELRNGNSKSA